MILLLFIFIIIVQNEHKKNETFKISKDLKKFQPELNLDKIFTRFLQDLEIYLSRW